MKIFKMAFPILSYDDAITSCKELFGVEFTEDDLRRPTSQFVKRLYLDIATASMQISSAQMLQPPLRFLDRFQSPDIFEEGASFIYFTIRLQRYMHVCMVKDFSKKDLTNPRPKRVLTCISAMVNFEKFKASQDSYYHTVLEEKDTLCQQRNQLQAKNHELKRKVAQIRVARSEDEEKVQQVLPVIDNLNKAVADLNKQQHSNYKHIQQLKTEIAEMTSKEAELKVLIANNKEQCEKFKGQIVTSPDRFRGELGRMNTAISACKDSIEEKGVKLLEKKNQEESINVLEENCAQAVRFVSSLEDETERQRSLHQKVQTMKDAIVADDEALGQNNFQLKNIKRQLSSQSEKQNRLELTNEKKFAAKNDEFEQRNKIIESLEKNRKPFHAEIPEMNTGLQEAVKTLNELEDDHAKNMDDMQDSYQQLISSINNYHGMLEVGSKRLLSALSTDE